VSTEWEPSCKQAKRSASEMSTTHLCRCLSSSREYYFNLKHARLSYLHCRSLKRRANTTA
jgi:hypothetical protein